MIELPCHASSRASRHSLRLSYEILKQDAIATRDSGCRRGIYKATSALGILWVEGCGKGWPKARGNHRPGAFPAGQIEPIGKIGTVSVRV